MMNTELSNDCLQGDFPPSSAIVCCLEGRRWDYLQRSINDVDCCRRVEKVLSQERIKAFARP
ncbi:hypothetical protein PMAYCL1PPCAC_26133 [Pristionchus mayeri]|uniref:Uncharacterized protein n=1 Tax=Pristionchus mayeri TaxID=1317129 RepID=A0AAN5D3F2_9BILA|nr:hypothetical protein PMAYCL1PPCAC_26133 [Pristionchus mayeri]